ncbi:glycosyltransferase family 4 protein [Leptospira brenneri]|uniref:Glycosyltransferase family 1 protein n=1 Tax=Leptospira brenneri TaxID=2023182 RepID=A0A2M9Y5T7_9LEPT|nr:glycosyltransferase family 1 protein [Leptospira brenneri]PJZ46921.1 glycosyl transferase [Leptospira brenneri]TGK96125.1 glycosyltransferase family 1 protein [Leptospira brenneri]
MRLKIGYDARMIENSGIGIRIQHILKFWPISPQTAELFIFGDPSVLKKYDLPKDAKIIEYKTSIYSPKEFLGHPQMAEMDVLDIPHFNIPFPYIRKCVVTIHDLIPYHFKVAHASLVKRVYLQIVFRWIKWFALKVITVSEFTKQDLIHFFGYSKDKISVVYNGIDLETFSQQNANKVSTFKRKHDLPASYLFTVGIGKTHKNFPFLLSNLEELWAKKELNLPLVVGGLSKEIPEEFLNFQKKYPDKIYFLSHLPYAELPLAYQAAKIFLYPSLFEGFGFPVLEAQAMGTVVFSSNASVLPEVLGVGYEPFDPKDSTSFQTKLLSLLKDSKRQNQLKKLGESNAKRFQWKPAIKELNSLYKTLLKS